MKNKLFILIFLSTIVNYSQIKFEKGYFIDNKNVETNCLIKNADWKNNPKKFEFKINENSEVKSASIDSIKEFGLGDEFKYIKSKVVLDISPYRVEELDTISTPTYQEEEHFLRVLVEGKATLYQLVDDRFVRYFYKIDNAQIIQLIYKRYLKSDKITILKNNYFKKQLFENMLCNNNKTDIDKIEYFQKDLVNFFIKFNKCTKNNYEKHIKSDQNFFLKFRPGLTSRKLNVDFNQSNYYEVDFETKYSYRIGFEAEFLLPFFNNKWSVFIDPNYQQYEAEFVKNNEDIEAGVKTINIDYYNIELPIGLKYNFYLNKNSKIFVNSALIMNFNNDSNLNYYRDDNSLVKSYKLDLKENFAFGTGYSFKNRYNIELQLQTNKKIIRNYPNINALDSTFSLIFGYTLF